MLKSLLRRKKIFVYFVSWESNGKFYNTLITSGAQIGELDDVRYIESKLLEPKDDSPKTIISVSLLANT